MLGADKSFVLDHRRVRKRPEQLDFIAELGNLVLALAFERNALDGNDLARVEVECSIDRAELAATDALAKLLSEGGASARWAETHLQLRVLT